MTTCCLLVWIGGGTLAFLVLYTLFIDWQERREVERNGGRFKDT